METKNLKLVLQGPAHIRALIAGAEIYQRTFGVLLADGVADFLASPEVSPEFRARVQTGTEADPWTMGFALMHRSDGVLIGVCGYKGPPGVDGVVEIGYGVAPSYQGNGYATEAAQALTANAFADGRVRIVRAHTLPLVNASTRVLVKCGFNHIGEVMDPEDGLVWRWEKWKE